MIYQTNKISNFVCKERFIFSREINPFSRNSFFLTTFDKMKRIAYSFYYLQFLNKHNFSALLTSQTLTTDVIYIYDDDA